MQTDRLFKLSTRRKFAGGAALAMIATLLVVAATTLAIRMARQVQDKTAQQQLTQQRMARIAKSLEAYWIAHGCKLPSGALGSSKTGDEVANGTTVPWRTLGIPQADAFDAWDRKISYKRDVKVSVLGGSAQSFDWALISHGATGLGAWVLGDPDDQQLLPLPTNPYELTNANLTSPLQVRPEKTGFDVLPVDLFDDFVQWGQFELELCGTTRTTADRLISTSPTPVVYTDRNSNTASITFDSSTEWGDITVSSPGGNISRNAYGTGIGVCSGACNDDATAALDASKKLAFKLDVGKTAQKFSIGILSIEPTVEFLLTFKNGGIPVGSSVRVPLPPPPPALPDPPPPKPVELGKLVKFDYLQPNPPGSFNEVEIQPLGTSRFFIASIRFCTAAENCN